MFRHSLAALSLAALTATPVWAESHTGGGMDDPVSVAARAEINDRDGNMIGTVTVNRTASGTALVILALNDLPEGGHAVHLHETGDCSADDFTSAGGHIAGEAEHGVAAQGGPHPGDLPNVVVGSDGIVAAEFFAAGLDIDAMVMDEDGAAFIVHAGTDDYMSQPAGDAGERIACGVFGDG